MRRFNGERYVPFGPVLSGVDQLTGAGGRDPVRDRRRLAL